MSIPLKTPAWAVERRINPAYLMKDIVVDTAVDDERYWVPYETNVWWRPLMFDQVNGNHTELLRVRKSGVLSRHKHPSPVHGYCIKGTWRYLEHDWVAKPGSYVFEPPGEIHTLVIDGDDEMITFFHISGTILYLDAGDKIIGTDDNHSLIEAAREHYRAVGLPDGYIDSLIR
jgi:quercetin dioxygenase-like cupin family protein